MKKQRIALCTAFILCVLAAGSTSFAYTWTVKYPSDLNSSITSCTVILHDRTPNSGLKDISRGGTVQWSSAVIAGIASPLFYLSGRCQYVQGGNTYTMQLKGRTCAGTDFTNAVDGMVSCTQNVSLKICPKQSAALADYYYGFCPN